MAVTDQDELHSRYLEMVPIQVDAMLWFSLCDMKMCIRDSSCSLWRRESLTM